MITIRKTVSLWTLATTLFAGAITLTSCSNNEDDYKKPYDVTDEDRVKYAEGVLGTTIDPEQDWVLKICRLGSQHQRPYFQELVYVPRRG